MHSKDITISAVVLFQYLFSIYYRSYSSWRFLIFSLSTFNIGWLMNPRIPHHKVLMPHASIISENEVSITVHCHLCSTCYTAVKIKNCLKSSSVIKAAIMKNMGNFESISGRFESLFGPNPFVIWGNWSWFLDDGTLWPHLYTSWSSLLWTTIVVYDDIQTSVHVCNFFNAEFFMEDSLGIQQYIGIAIFSATIQNNWSWISQYVAYCSILCIANLSNCSAMYQPSVYIIQLVVLTFS